MNKIKRKIHRNNVALMKTIAKAVLESNLVKYPYIDYKKMSQVDIAEEKTQHARIIAAYTKFLITPVEASHCVLNGKPSKLQSVARLIRHGDRDSIGAPWGNLFTVKFPMCVWAHRPWSLHTNYVAMYIDNLRNKYTEYIQQEHPSHKVPSFSV